MDCGFEYNGNKYTARRWTIDLKHVYCVWLYRQMLDNDRQHNTQDGHEEFKLLLASAPPEWGTFASKDVLRSLGTRAGNRMVYRLVFQIDNDKMTDQQIDELEKAKTSKPSEPYTDLEHALIWARDGVDPKPKPAVPGSESTVG